jgi:general secretion pathway protein K
VLWVLALLSILTLAVGYQVRQRLRFIQHLEIRSRLRQIADAGIKKAVWAVQLPPSLMGPVPTRWRDEPAWFRDIPFGGGAFTVSYVSPEDEEEIHYGVEDEESKLNLNRVTSPAVLSSLLVRTAGMATDRASDLAASIMDWKDEDDYLSSGGAESRYYQGLNPAYRAKNGDFDSLEELLLVKGMAPEIFEKIRPYVTLEGGGIINLNTVSEPVLLSFGLSQEMVAQISAFRTGPDGKSGTPDDRYFTGVSGLAAQMESAGFGTMTPEAAQALEQLGASGFAAVDSNFFTARSRSTLRGRPESLTVVCVIERGAGIVRCLDRFESTRANRGGFGAAPKGIS